MVLSNIMIFSRTKCNEMSSVIFSIFFVFGYLACVNGQNDISPARPSNPLQYYSFSRKDLPFTSVFSNDHPCKRECVYDQPMSCYYRLVVHYYEVADKVCQLTSYNIKKGCIIADGIPNGVILAGRNMMDPIIEVCENDTIVADVVNYLREDTTVHWHGIHQKLTPHMDGSPFTTQYPIPPGETFQYKFEVHQSGTYWWHSHMDFQRAYGMAGPLIVRKPLSAEPHAHLYDYDLTEHVVIFQDWFYNYTTTLPQNVVINGKGHNNATILFKKAFKERINYERFRVTQGYRYRLRFIYNGNANCPLEISIDNHEMLLINSDGHDLEPISIRSLIIMAAERYDVVVYASERVNNYWLRAKGHGFCARNQIHQAAILHYDGAPEYALPKKKLTYDYSAKGIQVNSLDVGLSSNPEQIPLAQMNSLEYISWENDQKFKTFYTSMGIYLKNGIFTFQMDDILFEMPKVSLLQSRYLDIERFFCNKTTLRDEGRNCTNELCKCLNIIQVPAYDYIEFVISAETIIGHPFHTHGFDFRVVGMGILGATDIKRIEEIDRKTPLKRRLDKSSAIKDTVQVPGYGYTIIRFYSDNPGYWMFHCHLTVHSEEGMMSILKIGEHDEMVPTPRMNYCEEFGEFVKNTRLV